MRRIQHGHQQGHSHFQAGCATGYLCRRTEEELERIGAASGGAVTPRELGEWVGKFLLSKSQTNPDGLDDSQRLSEVRTRSAQGYALGTGEAEAHVQPRHKRTLSAKALKAISNAQKKRWAKIHAKQKPRTGTGVKPANWLKLSKSDKQRWYRQNPGLGTAGRGHPVSGVHWTQTPRGRKFMAKTAAARFHKNSVPKIMPRGFWQREIGRLLAHGPMERHALHARLAKRYPEKYSNLFVTFASMKSKGELIERDGVFSLPTRSTEAANGGVELAAS